MNKNRERIFCALHINIDPGDANGRNYGRHYIALWKLLLEGQNSAEMWGVFRDQGSNVE